jgi:hypothetical protein
VLRTRVGQPYRSCEWRLTTAAAERWLDRYRIASPQVLRQTELVTAAPDDGPVIAGQIASRHGGTAAKVVALPGVVNRVFRVTGSGYDWVIRYPQDVRRANEFPVEIWAGHQASLLGIPTPSVVATGHLNHRPYLVLDYIQPQEGQSIDDSWRWLGRYATVMSAVPLDEAPQEIFSRFGRDLPTAWRAHLDYNLEALSGTDPLIADGIYRPKERGRLRALIEQLRSVDFPFGLAHGDLAPRNLIPRRAPSPPVLLDWGTATSGPALWTDLQRVYAWWKHDQTISRAALDQFAIGAGVTLDRQAMAVLEQLSAARFLDLARWARERRPDLYQQYRQTSRQGLTTVLTSV